jgi:hypothetical protein
VGNAAIFVRNQVTTTPTRRNADVKLLVILAALPIITGGLAAVIWLLRFGFRLANFITIGGKLVPILVKQFTPNGGTSLLDKIDGMSGDIKQIAADTNTAKQTAAKADKSSSEASAAATEAREAVKALKTDFADVKAHLGRQDEMMKKAMPPDDVKRVQT